MRSTAHPGHVTRILEQGLSQGSHSDVTISVSRSKKLIRCHKSVLANSSMFMRALLEDRLEPEEPVHIHLCEIGFAEAMAMLNIVYVGRVKLQQAILEETKAAAKAFLNLTVQVEPTATVAPSASGIAIAKGSRGVSQKLARSISASRKHISSSKSRPLLIKAPPNSHAPPVLVVLAPQQQRISSPHMKSEDLLKGASIDENTIDFSSLNSYQKAKLRCADKFKCDQCGKGFPLGCLLQRHKRTHLDSKPHSCNYCDKVQFMLSNENTPSVLLLCYALGLGPHLFNFITNSIHFEFRQFGHFSSISFRCLDNND